MATKMIAVQGFSTQISNALVNATLTLTGTPSVKCKAGGNGMCKNGFSAVVTAITVPSVGATIPDPGPYNISFSATASKVKADGTLVLRVDDETGTVNATPKIPGSPPTPYPVSFKYKISAAGQSKAQGA